MNANKIHLKNSLVVDKITKTNYSFDFFTSLFTKSMQGYLFIMAHQNFVKLREKVVPFCQLLYGTLAGKKSGLSP